MAAISASASVSLAGTPPPPELAQQAQPLETVPQVVMPPVDVAALLAEDVTRATQGLPPRFAQPIPVQIDPENSGLWEVLPDGSDLWRLRISAPKALSLNLGFTTYGMPDGGSLYLYTPDYQIIRGPFTAQDNELHGQLWSPILLGDEIVIEVKLPVGTRTLLRLELTSVNYGYSEIGQSPLSGMCNVDVVCPAGDLWRDEIRSVAVISTGGSTFCTGFLVNNTAQDLTPYFMTANHCGINNGTAPSLVTYWNYENSWCRPVDDPVNGQPGDGQLNQYNTGSYFRSAYSASDFTLVELDDPINPVFNVHWAGWDRTSNDATSAVAIHHPNTDEKRISFEYDPTTTTSYLGTSIPGDGTHVRITDWDLGTTEPGSSGSPLFDQNHHIVGQLHGGYAACYNDDSDWYGRISVSWTGGGSSASRLSDWLDPTGSGVPYLDGRDLVEAPFNLAVTPDSLDVCMPDDAEFSVYVTQAEPGFVEPVTLAVYNNPANTIPLFSENPVVPTATVMLTITETGAALEGLYEMDVVGTYLTDTVTDTVGLNLYSGIPLAPTLVTPPDGDLAQPLAPQFTWTPNSLTGSYSFELDLTPLFASPVLTATELLDPEFSPSAPLEGGTCYWWRVEGTNVCGDGLWSDPFHFATVSLGVSFYDDIESGDGNWTHQAAQGVDHWAISEAQSHSPTHAWFVPDDDDITDTRLWNTTPITIGAGSTLSFWHRYQFEGSSWDGSVLEISTDGGSTWSDLGTYITANGYNGTISSSYSNPLGGRQGWVGDLTAWTEVTVDLNSFAGQSVNIRWRLGCDSSVNDEGWYIDDVQITSPLPPNPAPTLLSITPDSGPGNIPTPVLVEGTGFFGTPNLKLGDVWLVDVLVVDDTTISATVPAGLAAGVYDLTIYNGDCQQVVLLDAYTVGEGAARFVFLPLVAKGQ